MSHPEAVSDWIVVQIPRVLPPSVWGGYGWDELARRAHAALSDNHHVAFPRTLEAIEAILSKHARYARVLLNEDDALIELANLADGRPNGSAASLIASTQLRERMIENGWLEDDDVDDTPCVRPVKDRFRETG